jgi:hypothetical protein
MASPSKVLKKVIEPAFFSNPHEQRVYAYLEQFIGGMSVDEVKRFLRFVTGNTVLTSKDIFVSFNGLSGIARRPLAHTCSNILEIPYTYATFLEFVEEFSAVLASDADCWAMDAM